MGQVEDRGCHPQLAEWLGRLPTPEDEPFVIAFEHGTQSVEMFAPRGVEAQTPHRRDEEYIVARGKGWFEDFTDDLAAWVGRTGASDDDRHHQASPAGG
jgi:hypothetical protein